MRPGRRFHRSGSHCYCLTLAELAARLCAADNGADPSSALFILRPLATRGNKGYQGQKWIS